MSLQDHSEETALPSGTNNRGSRNVTARRSKWVFGGFVAIALLMLAVEHRMHLLDWLPWLFLAACPLMHLFMHHGHNQGNHDKIPSNGDGK